MTERGPLTGVRGGPDPAEPSHSPPEDLGAVRRTDALIEALSARQRTGEARPGPEDSRERPEDSRERPSDDPAVRLLHALITDVDDPDSGPGTAPQGPGTAPQGPGPRRRGPRTIVALGVAGAVLASSGVAAAGGGVTDQTTAFPAPSTSGAPDTGRAVSDPDATTRDRSRPSARPAPGGATAKPDGQEHPKTTRPARRLDPILRLRPKRPEPPTPRVNSAPSTRPDQDTPRLRIEDLHGEAKKRALRHRDD